MAAVLGVGLPAVLGVGLAAVLGVGLPAARLLPQAAGGEASRRILPVFALQR